MLFPIVRAHVKDRTTLASSMTPSIASATTSELKIGIARRLDADQRDLAPQFLVEIPRQHVQRNVCVDALIPLVSCHASQRTVPRGICPFVLFISSTISGRKRRNTPLGSPG